MRSISALGHAQVADLLALAISTNTGRAGSNDESALQIAVSNDFCVGCGASGSSPSTEPRCAASTSRSSTCAPAAASASSRRLLPEPVAPQIDAEVEARRAASRGRATTWRAECLVAAIEPHAHPSPPGAARARASPSARRHASSRRAASSRAACRAKSALDVRARCCAPRAARRRASPRTPTAACRWCRRSARSSSSSTGTLMAPGRWSSANSAGLRASRIASKALQVPRARAAWRRRRRAARGGTAARVTSPSSCSSGSSAFQTLSRMRGCAAAVGCSWSAWKSSGLSAMPSSRNGTSGAFGLLRERAVDAVELAPRNRCHNSAES